MRSQSTSSTRRRPPASCLGGALDRKSRSAKGHSRCARINHRRGCKPSCTRRFEQGRPRFGGRALRRRDDRPRPARAAGAPVAAAVGGYDRHGNGPGLALMLVCSWQPCRQFLNSVEIHREVTSGDDARGERIDDLELASAALDQVISLPSERLPDPTFPISIRQIRYPPSDDNLKPSGWGGPSISTLGLHDARLSYRAIFS